MRVTYDAEADVFGFELARAAPARTMQQPDGVLVGYDSNGRVVSITVIEAKAHFDDQALTRLGSPAIELSLAEASEKSGLAAGTLRVLLNSGRLEGEKRGRDWVVTLANLDNYLESRAPAGRPAFRYKARQRRPMMVTSAGDSTSGRFLIRGARDKQRVAKGDLRGMAASKVTHVVKRGAKATRKK
jgi:uncharacterized protein YuzE